MRLRSSDGWNEKSKPDSVLIGGQPRHLQRRLDAAALTDGEFLGEQRLDRLDGADLTALELLDQMVERLERPRHAQADQMVADPLDRGVRRGLGLHAAAPRRPAVGRRRRRTPGDAARRSHRRGRRGAVARRVAVGRRWQAAMPGGDAPLAAALQHRMNGDQASVLEDAHLAGGAVHLDRPTAGRIGHAVEIAVDRDHAVAGDAPLEPQHRLERAGRQRLEVRPLLGEVLGDDAPGGGMGAHDWRPGPATGGTAR